MDHRRVRDPKCKKLEAVLAFWQFEKEQQSAPLTNEVLVDKEQHLASDFDNLEVPENFFLRCAMICQVEEVVLWYHVIDEADTRALGRTKDKLMKVSVARSK